MRASKLLHRILKFINYANLFKINEKCYFSVIFWPILILFIFSDRAWCGLQNFYTEFWNSLIMQICANLFKINEKCYFSVISWAILILFGLSDRTWWGLQKLLHRILKFINYANLFQINEKCHLSSIQKSQQICTSGWDVYYASRNLLSTCFKFVNQKLHYSNEFNNFIVCHHKLSFHMTITLFIFKTPKMFCKCVIVCFNKWKL